MLLKTIDAHTAGQPLRLIVDGFPAPRGKTMMDKRDWVARHADHARRALMLEPRGHADMYGAVLTEPVAPGSHAGLLFMDNDGYATMSGDAVIAATTIALERGLLVPGGDGRTVVFDTPGGSVRATAVAASDGGKRSGESSPATPRVDRVAFTNVPSFVVHGGVEVVLGARRIRADIAYGGEFYAIVDSESVGLPIDRQHLPELRRAASAIRAAVGRMFTLTHPHQARIEGLSGTIFTGPSNTGSADLRNVTVFGDEQVARSPSATGTAAVMAVVDAMGLLDEGRAFVQESIIDTTLSGRITGRAQVGDYEAIVPEIAGAAWITGEHTFIVDAADPLAGGFRL